MPLETSSQAKQRLTLQTSLLNFQSYFCGTEKILLVISVPLDGGALLRRRVITLS